MIRLNYIQMFPYAVSSLMGVLVVFNISEHLVKFAQAKVVRFLIYVGGYTFNVLTWHFISMKVVSLLIIVLYGLSMKRLSEFAAIDEYARQGWWVVYFIVGVAIPVAGTWVYHKIRRETVVQ